MAYDFLKKLFKKDENGAIIPMTAEELEAAIDADKNIKVQRQVKPLLNRI